MLLAVDVGNTNVVFALFDGREIRSRWRVATDPRRTADEYAVWLLQLMKLQGFDPERVRQILISTVVPRADQRSCGKPLACWPLVNWK